VAVCCVLPVAIIFLVGLVAPWAEGWGRSAVTWWIALGALGGVVAAIGMRRIWKRRSDHLQSTNGK